MIYFSLQALMWSLPVSGTASSPCSPSGTWSAGRTQSGSPSGQSSVSVWSGQFFCRAMLWSLPPPTLPGRSHHSFFISFPLDLTDKLHQAFHLPSTPACSATSSWALQSTTTWTSSPDSSCCHDSCVTRLHSTLLLCSKTTATPAYKQFQTWSVRYFSSCTSSSTTTCDSEWEMLWYPMDIDSCHCLRNRHYCAHFSRNWIITLLVVY